MIVYWIMLILPVIGVMFGAWLKVTRGVNHTALIFIGMVCVAAIGLRHEVGGDWEAYLDYYYAVEGQRFLDALMLSDPAYMLINWLSFQIGGGIYLVNAIIGLIVVSGVLRLALRQPYPAMAFMAAVPYLLVVVSMGYSRQAAAIGFVFHGIVFLTQNKIFWALISLFAAILFHKTAMFVAILLIGILLIWRMGVGLVAMSLFTVLLLVFDDLYWTRFEAMYESYVVEQMESAGGVMRYAMIVIPSSLLVFFSSRFRITGSERKLWLVLWVASIGLFPILSEYSTLVDRILLYWYPLVVVFWGRVLLLASNAWGKALIRMFSSAVHVIILWYWLSYAVHAEYWVPYKMYPFV